MLGKLYKYDMKALNRMLLPLSLGILSSSLLCTIALKILVMLYENDRTNLLVILSTVMGIIFIGISAFALIAYPTVVLFINLSHYYRNFFTDEGYLTFTLPVNPSQLLLSKFLATLTHSAISIAVLILSVLMIVLFGTDARHFINTDFMNGVSELWRIIVGELGAMNVISYAVNLIISGVYLITLAFLSVTIGAVIAKKHKILAAVGIYYVINMATSLISGIFAAVMNIFLLGGLMEETSIFTAVAVMGMVPLMNIIIYLGFTAAAYILCGYLLKNKLNLQ